MSRGRAREVVGVDPVDGGAAAAGGVEGRDVERDGLDGEALAREVAEVAAADAVEFFGDEGGAHEEFFGGFGVELRVGAEEVEEGGEVALEAGLLDDGEHFGVDLGHFVEADLVDLGGCEGGGGVFEDLVLVVVLAVGEVFGGERSDGVGDVLVVVRRRGGRRRRG